MQPERKDVQMYIEENPGPIPPSPILYSKQIPEDEVLKKFCATGSA
jgi:hypothetical protein